MMKVIIKTRNVVLKTRNYVLKTRNFVLKMMNFAGCLRTHRVQSAILCHFSIEKRHFYAIIVKSSVFQGKLSIISGFSI